MTIDYTLTKNDIIDIIAKEFNVDDLNDVHLEIVGDKVTAFITMTEKISTRRRIKSYGTPITYTRY